MTVYVDELVAINIFVNYFLLLGAKTFLKADVGRMRLFLGAATGGVYSLVIFLPNLPNSVTLLMNFAASALIVIITFSPRKFRSFVKYFAAFFGVNFVFAGLMLAIWFVFRPQKMVYNNSVVYFDINMKTLVFSTVICYLILSAIAFFARRTTPADRIYNITLFNKGRTIMTKALLDTGHSLKDGFSGKPVIIADKKTVEKLAGCSLDKYFNGNNALSFSDDGDAVRLIPFNTVGSGGMLKAIRIDGIKIEKNDTVLRDVIIAQSNTEFNSEEYSVLINNAFFEERGKKNVEKIFKIPVGKN